MDRRKATDCELLTVLIHDVVRATKGTWSLRQNRTIILHVRELLRRLDPDLVIDDIVIDRDIIGL